ncbi:MAG: hypothetical protein HPY50_03310 [Firmicutes bacterium]|nr:hypothetical protein [Bacillota bacterium]
MKSKRLLAFILLTALAVTLVGCGGKAPEQPAVQTTTAPAPAPMNAKALEMEKALMNQLQPMPNQKTGDKIGVLVITVD